MPLDTPLPSYKQDWQTWGAAVDRHVRGQNTIVNVRHYGASPSASTATNATAIADAVAAAGTGGTVYWPAGDYPTGTSIPNLHTVRHEGPGVITRTGGVRFHVEPHGTQANTLHVSPSGATSSDGLSATQPTTFAVAFSILRNYGPLLDGVWTVSAAAGTHAGVLDATHDTPSRNRVVITGPSVGGHPNVPTAVIDGAGGVAYQHGIRVTGVGVRAELRDLKALNYTAGTTDRTRIGFVAESESDVIFTNVHAMGSSWCGIYAFTARTRVNGGILDDNRSNFIANSSDSTLIDTIVRNGEEYNAAWTRGSQGHADYLDVEDGGVGILTSENSRVHTVGCDFRRNTYPIRAHSGGVWIDGAGTNNYYAGTADANAFDNQAFGYGGDAAELTTSSAYLRVGYDRAVRTLTGTTALTQMATPYTLPARRLVGAGKQVKVEVHGMWTVTGGSSLTVSFGGMNVAFTAPAAGSFLAFKVEVTLFELTGGYRAVGVLTQGVGGSRHSTSAAGFDATIDQAVVVSATPAATTDTVNIYRTDVWVMG